VATSPERSAITVVSHSNLFYWWPVWAVGFLMALLTFIDGHLMVTVPKGTKAIKEVRAAGEERAAYVLPQGQQVATEIPGDLKSSPKDPRVHMAQRKGFGVIFCTVLLICIVITNVPLRGMWSVVVIITLILLTVIAELAGWMEHIVTTLSLLDVRINLGGYLFISGVLFAIWLIVMLVFDRQIYIVFTPGQFKVCTEIGGGEKVYDTMGMKLERQRGDLFRHYILGLGSGDLIVKTAGAAGDHFDLPNVLFISKKVQQIEDMLQKRKVVEQR
jgi:hypothetical protein